MKIKKKNWSNSECMGNTNKKSSTMSKDHNLVLPYAIYDTPFSPETSSILTYALTSASITHHHEKSQ